MTPLSLLLAAALAGVVGFNVVNAVRGKFTFDLGWGRSFHRLGPIVVTMEAPRELVYETIAGPYLGRTPKSMRDHLQVETSGDDYALATHYTDFPLYTAETVELVEFDAPERVSFRHLRGPVPYAQEAFVLSEPDDGTTELEYTGELGIDFWGLGAVLARTWVVPWWEDVVRSSLEDTKEAAEGRAAARTRRDADDGG